MRNGEFVKYDGRLIHFRKGKDEFKMYPGDRLTAVPIPKPIKFLKLRNLWFRVAPEFWRAHKRRRSHLAYLNKNGLTDPKYKGYFGSQSHIADETLRAAKTPPVEYVPFDCKKKNTIRQNILDAVKLSKMGSTKFEG